MIAYDVSCSFSFPKMLRSQTGEAHSLENIMFKNRFCSISGGVEGQKELSPTENSPHRHPEEVYGGDESAYRI